MLVLPCCPSLLNGLSVTPVLGGNLCYTEMKFTVRWRNRYVRDNQRLLVHCTKGSQQYKFLEWHEISLNSHCPYRNPKSHYLLDTNTSKILLHMHSSINPLIKRCHSQLYQPRTIHGSHKGTQKNKQ